MKGAEVGLLSRSDLRPWLRQIDSTAGDRFGVSFTVGSTGAEGALVVLDEISKAVSISIPRDRRILVLTEPPEIKTYRPGFANQFGVLVSAYPLPGFRGSWIECQPGLPWFLGLKFHPGKPIEVRLDFARLRALAPPAERQSRVSVVCSTKTLVLRHRQRLALIEHLTRALPGRIDVFGRGFQEVDDKAEAILPYKYHLVLENSDVPHFWTEKLADAYLGHALPLFSGCANVTEYFPAESLVILPPIEDLDGVTAVIADVLARDPYEAHAAAIAVARQRLLDEHNLMSLLARVVNGLGPAPPASAPALLRPARDFKGLANVARAIERLLGGQR